MITAVTTSITQRSDGAPLIMAAAIAIAPATLLTTALLRRSANSSSAAASLRACSSNAVRSGLASVAP